MSVDCEKVTFQDLNYLNRATVQMEEKQDVENVIDSDDNTAEKLNNDIKLYDKSTDKKETNEDNNALNVNKDKVVEDNFHNNSDNNNNCNNDSNGNNNFIDKDNCNNNKGNRNSNRLSSSNTYRKIIGLLKTSTQVEQKDGKQENLLETEQVQNVETKKTPSNSSFYIDAKSVNSIDEELETDDSEVENVNLTDQPRLRTFSSLYSNSSSITNSVLETICRDTYYNLPKVERSSSITSSILYTPTPILFSEEQNSSDNEVNEQTLEKIAFILSNTIDTAPSVVFSTSSRRRAPTLVAYSTSRQQRENLSLIYGKKVDETKISNTTDPKPEETEKLTNFKKEESVKNEIEEHQVNGLSPTISPVYDNLESNDNLKAELATCNTHKNVKKIVCLPTNSIAVTEGGMRKFRSSTVLGNEKKYKLSRASKQACYANTEINDDSEEQNVMPRSISDSRLIGQKKNSLVYEEVSEASFASYERVDSRPSSLYSHVSSTLSLDLYSNWDNMNDSNINLFSNHHLSPLAHQSSFLNQHRLPSLPKVISKDVDLLLSSSIQKDELLPRQRNSTQISESPRSTLLSIDLKSSMYSNLGSLGMNETIYSNILDRSPLDQVDYTKVSFKQKVNSKREGLSENSNNREMINTAIVPTTTSTNDKDKSETNINDSSIDNTDNTSANTNNPTFTSSRPSSPATSSFYEPSTDSNSRVSSLLLRSFGQTTPQSSFSSLRDRVHSSTSNNSLRARAINNNQLRYSTLKQARPLYDINSTMSRMESEIEETQRIRRLTLNQQEFNRGCLDHLCNDDSNDIDEKAGRKKLRNIFSLKMKVRKKI
eukprot:Awhi_evm1s6937